MPNEVEVAERVEILFTAQGRGQPMSEMVDSRVTVAEFGAIASRAALVEDVVEVFSRTARSRSPASWCWSSTWPRSSRRSTWRGAAPR
jgi:hypothetical protein